MIQLPSVMEALDILTSNIQKARVNKFAERTVLIRLLRICSNLHEQLLVWYQELTRRVPSKLYWVVPSLAHNPADDSNGRIFPQALHFPSLQVAQLLLLYWPTMIVLYRTIQSIHQQIGRSEVEKLLMQSTTELKKGTSGGNAYFERSYPSVSHIAALARNICQSVEYCYRSKNGTLGLQSTVFSLWVAREFFASQPNMRRELEWCAGIGNMTGPDSRFDLQVMKLSTKYT